MLMQTALSAASQTKNCITVTVLQPNLIQIRYFDLIRKFILLYTVSQKKGPTLKRYSSKLYRSILMIFGGNIQKSPE